MTASFEQVKKLAKNTTALRKIVDKAPSQYKNLHNLVEMDQNKMSRKQFENVLDYISMQAQITPPTKQQKYQIFCQFNPNNDPLITKEEYDKFVQRIFQMLVSTQNI